MEPGNIKASFIFEILGKPPEHIKETLEQLMDKLGEQKGVNITNRIIHEPKLIDKEEETGNIYTTFAEVEVIVDDFRLLIAIVLNMLPSHVEITEPSELRFKNFDLSSILTELTLKIHKYDEISKAILIERNTILKKLQEAEERARELEKEIKGKPTVKEEAVEEKDNSQPTPSPPPH